MRLVCKEWKKINKILLEGVTVNNIIGSLAALSDAIWFGGPVKAHPQGQCLDMHKVFIGRQILASDCTGICTVFLTFAIKFDLLNIFPSVASGYSPQLCWDKTSIASAAAFNKVGFSVNMLGSSFFIHSYASRM